MDYWKLVSDAFKITWRHKYLWLLGILAALTEGNSLSSFNYSLPSFRDKPDSGKPFFESVQTAVVKGVSNNISDGISFLNSPILWTVLILFFLVLFLIIIFFSLSARAGMVKSVSEIEKGKESGFGKGLRQGISIFWRIFGLELVVVLMVLLALLITALPAIILAVLSQIALLILWIILLILPLIIFFIYLSLLEGYAVRILTVEGKGVFESLGLSHQFIKGNFKNVLVVWLIAIILGLAISLGYLLVLVLLLLPLLALGFLIYLVASWLGVVIYALFFGFILLIFLMFLRGVLSAFTSAYWTLSYLRIKTLGNS